MATIIDTLNLKLTQAQEQFYQYSSAIIEGLTTGNIKPNVNKKLSIIAYWLEMLETGIPTCQSAEIIDPEPITITITKGDFFNLSGQINCQMWEYIWVRNKFNEVVPLSKFNVEVSHSYYSSGAYLSTNLLFNQTRLSLNYGFSGRLLTHNESNNGIIISPEGMLPDVGHNYAGARAPYNNADGGGEYNSNYLSSNNTTPFPINATTSEINNNSFDITFTFKNVGAMYNNQKIETTGRFLNINSPEILGGRDAQFCASLTQDQINCYSKILDYIAIELGFNYKTSLIEPISYTTIISDDNNEAITLEDNSNLDIEDPHNTGEDDVGDPNMNLPKSRKSTRRNNNSKNMGSY